LFTTEDQHIRHSHVHDTSLITALPWFSAWVKSTIGLQFLKDTGWSGNEI